MSTDQLTPRGRSPARDDVKLVKYEAYIDAQVESTRRLVKIVDLATSLVVLVAGVLAYLLALAVVEHWLVADGFSLVVRVALFAILAGGVVYFAYRRIWPLAIGTINPVYAAQAIEQSGPSLKNSLINLLLFRQRRTEISEPVYRTLEEQAAQRLSRVPIDAAVDRSLLIRFGYVLLAVVALASLYKVFSPKDPLVAAQRVLMPWADIVPASRVSITDVEPGSVVVSRGEFLNVSADVRRIGVDDSVVLRFTTKDGQAVNKSVPMKLTKDGLRFEARLPAGDAASDIGLSQDLRYRIEAGDARSLDYEVTVVAAPSIVVERVEYDYPDYTLYPDGSVEGLADIRAIEGTRVTIHARANGAIQDAHVDFNADGRRDLPMSTSGADAQVSFDLRLRDDRVTPQHASYVLRFTDSSGRTNRDPVKSAIDVTPDRSPEAGILLPKEKELQVRLDETVAIEIEARDPDFKLSEVRLRGEVAGRAKLDERLLDREHRGRFTRKYSFTPSAHDLQAGDVLQYWVTASDNRTPEPNAVATERKLMRIVSPDPNQQPPPDRLAQNDRRDRQQERQPGGEQPQEGQPQDGAGNQDGQANEQQPGAGTAGGEGGEGENQRPQDGERDGQSSGENAAGSDSEQRPGDEAERQQGQEAGGEDGQAGAGEQQGDPSDGQEGDQGAPGGQAQPGQRNSEDKQTGAGAAGGDPSSEGEQPAGTRQPDAPGAGSDSPDGTDGQRPLEGQHSNGAEQGTPSAEQSPVSSDGDNDAEAFERIRRHLEREGELPQGDARPSDEANRDNAEPSAEQRRAENEGESDGAGEASDENRPEPGDASRGAETQGEDSQQVQEPDGEQLGQKESSSGDETSTQGPSGAGEEQQPQGAPNSQPEMKPDEKRQQAPTPGDETDSTEPPAGGRGKKESDSQGEQGGDRAGGGEEGGGQKAPREGTGSAGQNQSADEGAGESTEQGAGSDSSNAGQDAPAEQRTGESGEEAPGRGSKQRAGEGPQPGGEEQAQGDKEENGEGGGESEENSAATREAEQDVDESSPREGQEGANQRGTATGGGGEVGATAGPPRRIDGTVPEGDEANLEYARKQTDLVLEKLADELNRKQVDEELLKDLGWTEDELRRFVERWQSRKEAAQRDDPSGDAAKRELDEALRSLGLRRGPLRQGPLKDDTLRDLREGYRGPIPLEYRERLRAYNEGVSRSRQGNE